MAHLWKPQSILKEPFKRHCTDPIPELLFIGIVGQQWLFEEELLVDSWNFPFEISVESQEVLKSCKDNLHQTLWIASDQSGQVVPRLAISISKTSRWRSESFFYQSAENLSEQFTNWFCIDLYWTWITSSSKSLFSETADSTSNVTKSPAATPRRLSQSVSKNRTILKRSRTSSAIPPR